MNVSNETIWKYLDRRFRIQLAIYLGILCLFLLARPVTPWVVFLTVGYLLLFWPLYFFLTRRARSKNDGSGAN